MAGDHELVSRLIGQFFLRRAEDLAFVVIVVLMFKTELARNQVRWHALAAEPPQLLREMLLRSFPDFHSSAQPLLLSVLALGHRHFANEGMRRDALFNKRGVDHAPAKLELTVLAAQAV